MTPAAPKLFVSYSHDSENHKDWVLTLATRLAAHSDEEDRFIAVPSQYQMMPSPWRMPRAR